MASFETLKQIAEHPEWIVPRSDVRVFLGEPGGPEATKTTVEPGNAFSPGMRTFGVTWWLRFPHTGAFFAPERASLESLRWSYEGGYLPLIHCVTHVDGIAVHHTLFQDGTAEDRSESVCGQVQLRNGQAERADVQLFIALRALGPAGGPLYDLKVGPDSRSLWLAHRNLPLLAVDRVPSAIGCGVGDPSPLAQVGEVPREQTVDDPAGWCFGLMRFDITLHPGTTWDVRFDCPLHSYGTLQDTLPSAVTPRPEEYEVRAPFHIGRWEERFAHLTLDVPDVDFRNAFFAGLQHMLTAVVGDQVRIAPLSYPLPWLRDSVYIIRCFDLAGFHDLARAATMYCARNDFFGGFGAEGDAPGEGLWALVQHYRITRDKEWLVSIYPSIQRKCDWLFRMRRADRPLSVVVDTPVLPFMHYQRNAGVICVPAQDGLIMGTMDHHVAISWVNHWAICGLNEAAYAAQELGHEEDAMTYAKEATELRTALCAFIERHPEYFEWERTVSSLLWPTRVWENGPQQVEAGFNAWWAKYRGSLEYYQPEPYWLYFELAQAHNALLLGQRERAWHVVQYRLQHQDLPGLYGWREGGNGVGTDNAVLGVTLINQLRGCHRFDSITPHGWSQAEMWLLQRAMLVEEWQGGLLLFSGVPISWLSPGGRVRFRGFPTWYGVLDAGLEISKRGDTALLRVSGAHPGVRVRVVLPGISLDGFTGPDGAFSAELTLCQP